MPTRRVCGSPFWSGSQQVALMCSSLKHRALAPVWRHLFQNTRSTCCERELTSGARFSPPLLSPGSLTASKGDTHEAAAIQYIPFSAQPRFPRRIRLSGRSHLLTSLFILVIPSSQFTLILPPKTLSSCQISINIRGTKYRSSGWGALLPKPR